MSWNPLQDKNDQPLTETARNRIRRDLINLFKEPPPGIFAVADESDLRFIHALIIGPMDTPYEGGMFYFVLKCPSNYPINPPKVKLMTTDAGNVRFNPNMYSCGMVCLSILGTWEGPAWSPAQQLSGLLISIQSIMNDKPYFNEPGCSREAYPGDVKRYNDFVRYQTLRVAVCGMMKNECHLNIPQQLQDIMEQTFFQYFDQYMDVAKQNMNLDGTQLVDPFSRTQTYRCEYTKLIENIQALHTSCSNKYVQS